MRPSQLNPLFAPLGTLRGAGPRIAKLLEKLTGPHIAGLLWHLPVSVIDRRLVTTIAAAPLGALVTLKLQVLQHQPPRLKKLPYRVVCQDATETLAITFFNANQEWIEETLPAGGEIVVSGRIEAYQGKKHIPHPDHIAPASRLPDIAIVEPVYGLTAGLSSKLLRRFIQQALSKVPAPMPEWQDPAWRARHGWAGFTEALRLVHNPREASDIGETAPCRLRLAYDELLANQLALALIRMRSRGEKGRSYPRADALRAEILAKLPFALTAAQKQSIAEIDADMAAPARMLRLLQGDVGSGKTLVALFAMLNAVAAGAQAVLMAPTEILAQQHLATLTPLLQGTGVRALMLTGRSRAAAGERKKILQLIETGYARIVIGTHALFQEDVAFHDLGMAVIDEQHRFGVHQRLSLAQKGAGVDTLVMTATPIPRTLALTAYGDLEVSRLTGKPPGRKPVETIALPLERLDEVAEAIARKIKAGERVYWVCPLVEISEEVDLAAAEERHKFLESRLRLRIGLVHGRMKSADKDLVMAEFAQGALQVLVATTVIEVGVNVPEATVMVIEHAERFGLAQLHQLRGRVGRGSKPSSCLLLYQAPAGKTAMARLRMMRETDDGFRIAEEDLRLRGAGEMLGTRQSGMAMFRMADIGKHEELLLAARDDVKLILERDAELTSERGQALRVLLYMFERDRAVRYLRSG